MFNINHQIPTLSKCREIAALKPEFKEIKKGGYVVFDYTINDSHTFDDPESLEMRGLAFNPESGNVVGLLLHKFFNHGEKSDQNIVIDGSEEILEKLDGTCIGIIDLGNGEWAFRTRAGETDHSRMVHTWLDKQPNKSDYVDFIEMCLENKSWPIFEFWSPENSVVITYDQPFLKLIAIRENDGRYHNHVTMKSAADIFNIPVVGVHSSSDFHQLLKDTDSMKGIEGFVVRTGGDWVKIKTAEYCQLHKSLDGVKFDKDVCLMVLDGTIDDVIPKLVEPRKSQVIELRDNIVKGISRMCGEAHQEFIKLKPIHNDRKQFAIHAKLSLYSSELFGMLDGKPVRPIIEQRFRKAAGGIHTWKSFHETL